MNTVGRSVIGSVKSCKQVPFAFAVDEDAELLDGVPRYVEEVEPIANVVEVLVVGLEEAHAPPSAAR